MSRSNAPLQGPVGRSRRRNAELVFRPVGASREAYPEWVRALRGLSGAYVIRERLGARKPVVVYVGQSQAKRLYETLTRHFQRWERRKKFWGGQFSANDPGTTYERAAVDVAVSITDAADALDEEARLIRRLSPRDNVLRRTDEEDPPF